MNRIRRVLPLVALFVLCALPAMAHEFIVKPERAAVAPGQETGLSVVSAHAFMVSEEMEPVDKVSVAVVQGGASTPVALAGNEAGLTLDGTFAVPDKGTAILAGHRQGMVWCNTTQGWKQASKKGLSGVVSSGLYEKFAKTLVTAGEPDGGFSAVVGHGLEIVPLTDPTLARPGDVIEFRILADGEPFAPEHVLATFDGFTDITNTYAYFTEPSGEGVARVKVDEPGLWMVRVQRVKEEPTEDYDKIVQRAVLVFEVQ